MADNPDYKPVSSKAAQTARSGRAILFSIKTTLFVGLTASEPTGVFASISVL